jgi:hypothetical protein
VTNDHLANLTFVPMGDGKETATIKGVKAGDIGL